MAHEAEIVPQHCNLYRGYDVSESSATSVNIADLITKSAPVRGIEYKEVVEEEEEKRDLKHQVSAPAYLNSLRENDLPPFRRPGPALRPKILTGSFLTDKEAIDMIVASEERPGGLKKYLAMQLVNKGFLENYALVERSFLTSLLAEVVNYGSRNKLDALKLSCMLTLYVNAHNFFKWFYWLPPGELWAYFKDILTRHTIQDTPDGEEVFDPEESYDILTHFHTVYMNNLPLIHILSFGAYRLKFSWPLNKK